MVVERSIVIARAPGEVFAYVADPGNDPQWCPKVRSVEPVAGEEARWRVVHKPVPGRPERQMDHRRTAAEPPRRLEWREDDGTDVFAVTYRLEPEGAGTRFTQRSEAVLDAPRVLRPLYKAGIGRDIAKQLNLLRRRLERQHT
jgi:uncharacterized protein YndB with AHSA1/START domain